MGSLLPFGTCNFHCRSVEQLDLEQGRWVPVESMLSRRSTLSVAVLDGCLYAVGGFDGTNGLDTVEKYNLGKSVKALPIHQECIRTGG